jgi:hypothetical protein
MVLGRLRPLCHGRVKIKTFDELVVQLGQRTESKYASSQWYKFKLMTRPSVPQALTQMQLSADQTVLSTNLLFTELHKCLVKVWRRALLAYNHDFVLDLEPYDVHECIVEGSMGTLLCFWVASNIVNKTKKGQVLPDMRFGSSLCLRMVVVANAAAGCIKPA